MATKPTDISLRERILQRAAEAVFHQGIRAKEINNLIPGSAVARVIASHHLPARDDLCPAYLGVRTTSKRDALTALVHDHDTLRKMVPGGHGVGTDLSVWKGESS